MILLLFIAACAPNTSLNYVPSGLKDTQRAGVLQVQLAVNPDTKVRNISLDDGLEVSLHFLNYGDQPIAGIVSLEDTPNDEQFGGIIGKEIKSFSVDKLFSEKPGRSVVNFPTIYYSGEGTLKSTTIYAEVRYIREIEFTSDRFWVTKDLREKPENCKKNCGNKNNLNSNAPVISSIREEVFDYVGGDFVVDSMQLNFDISEGSCEIIPYSKSLDFEPIDEKEEGLEMEISLKEAGNLFSCSVDPESSKNRKAIICVIDKNIQESDYEDRISGKIRYGCRLLLKSGEIRFG